MARCYQEPFLAGNVVTAVRNRAAESLTTSQRFASNVFDDVALCNYIEGVYLSAKRDGFKSHPELKKGVELRCENKAEAQYLSEVVARQLQGVTPVKITYVD